MDKLKLKTWLDEQVETLGISVFAEQLGLSRIAINNLQAAKSDSVRHSTLKLLAAYRNQSIQEVKEWLQIDDRVPVQGSERDRLTVLEQKYEQLQGDYDLLKGNYDLLKGNYDLLRTEVTELRTLMKVLVERQNGEKRARASNPKV
jgi:hypothetical protein